MLRPNYNSTNTIDVVPENKSEKRVRMFMAVVFFLQTFTTTLPFIRFLDEDGLIEHEVSALQFIIQNDGIGANSRKLLLIGLPLVLLPLISFFFCIFDKRSRVKYLFTGLCSVICAVLITFSVGSQIHYGAVITLIMNVVTLFMTSQGFQITTARMAQAKKTI